MNKKQQTTKSNDSTKSTDNKNKNSDWAEFLAQRQKRKLLIKQKKASIDKQSNTLPLQKQSDEQSNKLSSPLSSLSISNNNTKTNWFNNNKNININWIDLYEDILYIIALFCSLFELENIMLSCKSWNNCITFKDETKWRIWYNAINYEIKNIQSLDRTGKSNHFIITQNSYSSYDSVYHFAKFSQFAPYILQFKNKNNKNIQNNKNNKNNNTQLQLYESLIKINRHSSDVIDLFIKQLYKNIFSEENNSKDESSLSSANPELIYLNNGYDTYTSYTTSEDECIDSTTNDNEDIIIIDDNEYNDNDKDILLIRNNIANTVKIYHYFIYTIKHNMYLELLYLFENIILIESRPLLRWFLFVMDRAQCFGKKNKLKLNVEKDIGNINDITIFLKYLKNYIRSIHSGININKNKFKYLINHQQYLLKMCVDIDEVRARGVSSLEYWMNSGTMICNPDL